MDEFLREKDVCIRGLAHPVVSRDNGNTMNVMQDDGGKSVGEATPRGDERYAFCAIHARIERGKASPASSGVSQTLVRSVAVIFRISVL